MCDDTETLSGLLAAYRPSDRDNFTYRGIASEFDKWCSTIVSHFREAKYITVLNDSEDRKNCIPQTIPNSIIWLIENGYMTVAPVIALPNCESVNPIDNIVELLCMGGDAVYKLTYIPRCLGTLPKLIGLHIEHQYLTEIPVFVGLVMLSVYNNNIIRIPPELVNLTILDVSRNPISEIPATLTKLVELRCTNTLVECIPATLVNLEFLHCGKSLITELPDTLMKLKNFYGSDRVNLYPLMLKNTNFPGFGRNEIFAEQERMHMLANATKSAGKID